MEGPLGHQRALHSLPHHVVNNAFSATIPDVLMEKVCPTSDLSNVFGLERGRPPIISHV